MGEPLERQPDAPKKPVILDNIFAPDFNTFKPGTDLKRDDNKDAPKKDDKSGTQPDAPPPGNIPRVKLSEGTDLFLPDVPGNWDQILDKAFPKGDKPKPGTEGGDKKGEKGDKKAPDAPQAPGDPPNVHRNADKKVDSVVYPDGKKREFTHDAKKGFVGVSQTDSQGTKNYVKKDDGKWYMKAGTLELPLAGEFDLRDNGDFALRNSPTQPWQVESPQGKISVERPQVAPPKRDAGPGADTRPAPPKVQVETTRDAKGNIETARLPDGTLRTYKYDESGKEVLQVSDKVKTPGGERTETWTRQVLPTGALSDKFTKTQPAGSTETREKVKPLDNGSYEYTDSKGERKTASLAPQGDGKPNTPWKADVKMDEKGRFKSIENDRFKRDYEYFEGTTKIKSYSVTDKQNGQSATWSRSAPESANWSGRTGQGQIVNMQGEFAVTDDGVHVVQRLGGSDGGGKENYAFLGNGTRVSIAATENNGLVASEGGQTRYVKRGDGSSVAFTNNDNTQISVFDGASKQRTTWTKGTDGNWKSDSPYETDARKDLKFNEKGELSYTDAKGDTRTRTLAGEEIVGKKDGSKLIFDNQGQLSKVQFGDVTRTFQKDAKGAITGVSETNSKGETKTLFPPSLKTGEKVEGAKLSEAGDLQYSIKGADGKVAKNVTERSNGLRLEHDADNTLRKSVKPNGMSRSFDYIGEGATKQLAQVTDTRQTKEGEKSTTWKRQADPSGKLSEDFHSETEKGKPKTPRKIGEIKPDGEYEYTTKDSKPGDKPRIQGLTAGDGGLSGSAEEARLNLLETMEKNLDEPRLKRMDEMMKAFESRMADRATARKLAGVTGAEKVDEEVGNSIARTYDNLAQMVNSDDSGTFFSKSQRAFLAENFLFHAQDTTTMDQGAVSMGGQDSQGHGTCWIQAAHIWGMTQRPEHMADLLKQVSLTGSYTTKNSGEKGDQPKTINFSKDYLKFPDGYQETGWSISKALDRWDRQGNMMRQCDGDRSPLGKIFDYTLPVIGGRGQSPGALDGGTHNSFTTTGNRWYTGNAEIMKMVTGDSPCDVKMGDHGKGTLIDGDMRKTLLEKGSVLNYSPGHMKSMHLKQVEGQWCIIQDNQHGEYDDRIVARISNLEAWAKGDKSAEKQVNELVKQRKYRLESDSTIKGMIKPTADSNDWNDGGGNKSRQFQPYRDTPGDGGGGYQPQPQPQPWDNSGGGGYPQPQPYPYPQPQPQWRYYPQPRRGGWR